MNIPLIPSFPKGMWLSDKAFILIRVSFSIFGVICVPISLIVIAHFVKKSRKKKINEKGILN